MAASTARAAAAPPPVLSGLPLWIAGLLLATANFLAILDMSIANVSVPHIAGSLGATTSQGTWVITSYAVAEAITVPLTGWLAGRFGAVKVFVVALTGFAIMSALCGLAPSLGVLVAFRVLQGTFGGPILPLSQTLLVHIFPPKQQPAAMGLWAVTTLVAPIMGPVLGGTLSDTFGWPLIFWINLPISLIAIPLIWRTLRRHDTATAKSPIDGVGLGLLVVWVGALQLMLDLGKEHDWFASPMIVALGLTSLVGFAAFLIWELTDRNPIVSLRVFRHRGFSMSMITLSLAFGGFLATNVIGPLWLQTNMGYTATWAGYVLGMFGVLAIVSAPVAAQLASRFDARLPIFLGLAWVAWVTFMRAGATSQMDYWQIAVWLLLCGVGMPLFFLPLTQVALGSVDPEETAGAAGLMSFIRTLSGAFATSIATTVWENNATRNQAALAGTAHTDAASAALAQSGMSAGQVTETLSNMVQGQAVLLATNQVFMACSVLFLVAAAAIWLAPKPSRAVDPGAAH